MPAQADAGLGEAALAAPADYPYRTTVARLGLDLLAIQQGNLEAVRQVLSAGDAGSALGHVNQSLEPGGTIFILCAILDDSRLTPSFAVKSNLNYLNIHNEGRAYTEGEYRDWLEEAGFVFLQRVVVEDGRSIIRARKQV